MRPWGWGVTLTLELIGVGVLILLNAFFVAAEYGLVTARRTRIIELHHQGNRRARAVLKITSDPQQFIAAMQLGVTLTSLGIGALGEQALARAVESGLGTVLAVLLAYLILTFFHVVIGELVPKGVALGHPEGTALWVAAPVRAFFTLFAPFDRRRPPPARPRASERRARAAVGGRASHAAVPLERARRDRARGAADDRQGLRVRRQGRRRRDGAAAGGRCNLGRATF